MIFKKLLIFVPLEQGYLLYSDSPHPTILKFPSVPADPVGEDTLPLRGLHLSTHLFPLVNVSNEAGETQKAQEAEDFGKADDAQGPGCLVDL